MLEPRQGGELRACVPSAQPAKGGSRREGKSMRGGFVIDREGISQGHTADDLKRELLRDHFYTLKREKRSLGFRRTTEREGVRVYFESWCTIRRRSSLSVSHCCHVHLVRVLSIGDSESHQQVIKPTINGGIPA